MSTQSEFMNSLAESEQEDDLPQTKFPIYLLGRSYSAIYGNLLYFPFLIHNYNRLLRHFFICF